MSYEFYTKRFYEVCEEIEEKKHNKKMYSISNIYFIQNIINKKIYIGRSIYNVNYRFKQHIEKSNNIKSDVYNNPLQIDIRKYGKENFFIGYLDCELVYMRDHCNANKLEMNYIKKYNTLYPIGYNVCGLKGEELKKWKKEKEIFN